MQCRAAVLYAEGGGYRVETVELDEPGPGDVIVTVQATPYCITDWLGATGRMGLGASGTLPGVAGHAAAGVVEAVGAGVTRHRVGDRVLVTATPECGVCVQCARGRVDQCDELFRPARRIGRTADGTTVSALGNTGTYATRALIREIGVFPVESDLPAAWLAMIGCGIVSGVGAVLHVGRVSPGDRVVVVGCGQLGLWMVQGARIAGAASIVAVDPDPGRRAVATQVGATGTATPEEASDAVLAATEGRGADVGFDAGGTAESVVSAFSLTRLAGTVVLTSVAGRDATVTLPLFDLALRGRDVRSSQSGRVRMRADVPRFVAMLESGALIAEPMTGAPRRLDEIDDAMAASRERSELTPMIMPHLEEPAWS